jgi:hypothetical protein
VQREQGLHWINSERTDVAGLRPDVAFQPETDRAGAGPNKV